ncbi:ICEBs1 excisionase [Salicibibacter halophilus]|uniref:ICEBs1 excisionase n=1 Tax=Salicibibacter halophilus TaxID=2502791 RepID=A0A514LLS8_9BACI|nr:ICEBs1 excisionase [Salicibibacter halophilus]
MERGVETLAEFYTPADVQRIMKVSEQKAYRIIRDLNAEMKQEGYMVIQGKVNRNKFNERFIYQGKSAM